MNVVLCEYAEKREFTAGNKARVDVVNILKEHGYRHIPLFCSKDSKIKIILQIVQALFKTFFCARRGDKVLVQYPYSPHLIVVILLKVLQIESVIKGFQTILLVHDINAMRILPFDATKLKNECEIFKCTSKVIVHSDRMREMLKEHVGLCKCVVLGPFDYLYSGDTVSSGWSNNMHLIVAGNLDKNKCGYVYKLAENSDINLNLYGISYTGEKSNNVTYYGAFPPDDLIPNMVGSFGIVWDGSEVTTCAGDTGEYLKFNSPHKFSLYIAAGLPVVIWKKAALAAFVEKENLGLVLDSLEDLSVTLNKVTEDDYKMMLANVQRLRANIISGEQLLNAIDKTCG